jgi:hypothetical protein
VHPHLLTHRVTLCRAKPSAGKQKGQLPCAATVSIFSSTASFAATRTPPCAPLHMPPRPRCGHLQDGASHWLPAASLILPKGRSCLDQCLLCVAAAACSAFACLVQYAVPGGLIGVGLTVDPTLTRADRLVGQVSSSMAMLHAQVCCKPMDL